MWSIFIKEGQERCSCDGERFKQEQQEVSFGLLRLKANSDTVV